MKILLVEDDLTTADFIIKGLVEEGYTISHAKDGYQGFFKATTEKFDIIISDVMMPGIDGFQLVQQLRENSITTPILLLSAKSSVEDRVKGLKIGGDDYLIKPFSFSELVARVETLFRRQTGQQQTFSIEIGDMSIDLIKHKVSRGGEEIILAPLEFNLLSYLAQQVGRVISRSMIIEHVWAYNFDPGTNVVEARICKLREKIDKGNNHPLIHTVRGFGYVLESR